MNVVRNVPGFVHLLTCLAVAGEGIVKLAGKGEVANLLPQPLPLTFEQTKVEIGGTRPTAQLSIVTRPSNGFAPGNSHRPNGMQVARSRKQGVNRRPEPR